MGGAPLPVFKRRKPDDSAGLNPHDAEAEHHQTHPGAQSGLAGAAQADSGLGVPPYRPAGRVPGPTALSGALPAFKESSMGRSPFAVTPPAPSLAAPRAATALSGTALAATALTARAPGRDSAPAPEPAERRTLVVGRGISVQGTVQDAERLVVEGTVEATMIQATELAVSPGGMYKGEVEVQDAEVAGTIDGTLTARGNLVVRASGRVLGIARCRRLQVEDGGQITGRIEMLAEPAARAPEPVREPAELSG